MPKNTVHGGASVYDPIGDDFARAMNETARAQGLTEEQPGVFRAPEGKRFKLTLTETTDEQARAGSDELSGPDATPYGEPDGRSASEGDVRQNKTDKSGKGTSKG